MSALGVLLFVVFLLGAIALHEFGHFATAKLFKIKVDKFFIGFGPKLWSVKRGETEYGISAIPLGGYVKIAGMNPLEEVPPEDRPRTFKAKPAWQRAIVLATGSITHFVVAIFLLAVILATVGQTDYDRPTLTIGEVGSTEPGAVAPAERAGIEPGDTIVEVAGRRVTEWSQVQDAIRSRPGQRLTLVVERHRRLIDLMATLDSRERDGETIGFLGVSPELVVIHRSAGGSMIESGRQVGVGMWQSLVAFKNIFSPSSLGRLVQTAFGNEERKLEDPTSIIGIGRASAEAARDRDFTTVFLYIVSFNVFIGVANLLPLPPLDGGHLAVLGWEKITRREVDLRRLIPITAMVISVFAFLFLFATLGDIFNPLQPPG